MYKDRDRELHLATQIVMFFLSVLVVLLRPEWVSPGLLAELQFSTVPFSTCFLQMARIVFGAGGLVPGN